MRREVNDLNGRYSIIPLALHEYRSDFTCGNREIDDFFNEHYLLYEEELLTKTYALCDKWKQDNIVSMFSVSNDSVKTPLLKSSIRNKIQRVIPNQKRSRSYPAVLLGQLGVDLNYSGQGIGSQTIEYVKRWFLHPDNKAGCRFLLVDSINDGKTIDFYRHNGFRLLYATEDEERVAFGIRSGSLLRTRMMYCDLKQWLLGI